MTFPVASELDIQFAGRALANIDLSRSSDTVRDGRRVIVTREESRVAVEIWLNGSLALSFLGESDRIEDWLRSRGCHPDQARAGNSLRALRAKGGK